MNFSVHIDEAMAKELARLVRRSGTNRNALINEALRHYVAEKRRAEWPKELLEAAPVPDLVPFEKHRSAKRGGPRFP